MRKFALCVVHSFGYTVSHLAYDEAPVWIFDTEEEAQQELERQFNEEKRICIDESGFRLGVDMECGIDTTRCYAHIITYSRESAAFRTDWFVGEVKN